MLRNRGAFGLSDEGSGHEGGFLGSPRLLVYRMNGISVAGPIHWGLGIG